jgi:hypothetical protein
MVRSSLSGYYSVSKSIIGINQQAVFQQNNHLNTADFPDKMPQQSGIS